MHYVFFLKLERHIDLTILLTSFNSQSSLFILTSPPIFLFANLAHLNLACITLALSSVLYSSSNFSLICSHLLPLPQGH